MATRKSTNTDGFKKSDGFVNLTVVIKTKSGEEIPLKAPVWGLDLDNPLHKKMLEHPAEAAAAIEVKSIAIHKAAVASDYKGVEF